jgi:hypothetical protein
MHARLLDFDRTYARDNRPCRHRSIAHHLAMTFVIADGAVLVNPLGDLGVDGLGQELLSS